jgi:glycosyltransferase involved in cell wall biosynthesis
VTRPLHVVFSTPAYRPAPSFGGPIELFTRLAEGLTVHGHELDVLTTSLTALDAAGSLRSRMESVGGVSVHYLATPVHFRWMGLTPTLPLHLERAPRPDVVHVFGFRDPIGTGVAAWCRVRRVPYLFEGLGMVAPKHRKVLLKRALDSTLYRGVIRGATLLVAASTVEAREYLAAGVSEERIVVRPHGFPEVAGDGRRREFRERLGVDDDTPLVLYVGRIAHGKGLELLVQIAAQLQDVHVAVVGPDGGHGVENELRALAGRLRVDHRVHFVGPLSRSELLPNTYADADVFVLPSSYENFGLVAAEAAAAGAPVVLTDRCGVAECFDGRGALVVPYGEAELRNALSRLLGDAELRRRLGDEAREVAAQWSWSRVLALQEDVYRRALGDG